MNRKTANSHQKILMVCIGNICRSPIAHGLLQELSKKAGLDWEVDSAAVQAYHIGSHPHQDSIAITAEHGIDISHQRAQLLTPALMQQYDIIYVMAEDVMQQALDIAQGRPELQNKLKYFMHIQDHSQNPNLLDPYWGGYDGFQLVYDQVLAQCQYLISQYSKV